MRELLRERRDRIVQAWIDKTFELFPGDSRQFFRNTKDRFANPLGSTICSEIEFLVDALIDGLPRTEIAPHLERIIQVTCIQEVTASEAVSFIFRLKELVRSELAEEIGDRRTLEQLLQFETAIDELAMCAFDSFLKFRLRISEIRVREAQVRVSTLLKMARVSWDELPTTSQAPGGCDQ